MARGCFSLESVTARQQAAGGEFRPNGRHTHQRLVGKDLLIQRCVLGLATIVELLADAVADFLDDLAGVDGAVHAALDGEEDLELGEVSLHGRLHVRVLQLAGEGHAVMGCGAMHLPQRCGGGRHLVEGGELPFPVGTEFGHHPALDEGRPHGRGIGLQGLQLFGIFGRQDFRDGGEKLRDLHDRALEATERPGEVGGVLLAVERGAEQAGGGDGGSGAGHIGADARIARQATGQAVGFVVTRRHAVSRSIVGDGEIVQGADGCEG
ncbi:MAG: hypothetical protein FD152_901 [Xanthobacteraceae bacterium]|nr:MAG: hypothetical protein FD152_901 [Xanthobacteraceae bacterium]